MTAALTPALTPRERRLLDALERLCRAGRIVEPILRGGLCPKCEAEPPTGEGLPDAVEFALAMCSNEDWSDLHDSLAAAEAARGSLTSGTAWSQSTTR